MTEPVVADLTAFVTSTSCLVAGGVCAGEMCKELSPFSEGHNTLVMCASMVGGAVVGDAIGRMCCRSLKYVAIGAFFTTAVLYPAWRCYKRSTVPRTRRPQQHVGGDDTQTHTS